MPLGSIHSYVKFLEIEERLELKKHNLAARSYLNENVNPIQIVSRAAAEYSNYKFSAHPQLINMSEILSAN